MLSYDASLTTCNYLVEEQELTVNLENVHQ